jgi:hypothetical protein
MLAPMPADSPHNQALAYVRSVLAEPPVARTGGPLPALAAAAFFAVSALGLAFAMVAAPAMTAQPSADGTR